MTPGMNDNDCGRLFALLSEYLDQELSPATCEELAEHLRGCPECIEFVESLKRTVQLCHAFGERTATPAPDKETMASLRQAYEKMLAKRRFAREQSSKV